MKSRVQILQIALFAGILMFSCTRIEVDYEIPHNLPEFIASLGLEGICVDKVVFEGDKYIFFFSNDEKIGFYKEDVPIITIDELGYWRLNGTLTDQPLEHRYIPNTEWNGHVIMITEGYLEWSFVFNEGQEVVLLKTVYSSDSDYAVRGINHRGYNLTAPENTLPAYRLSRLMGFTYAEADIRFTSDGVPVLLHDATVDRTSDGSGSIADLSWNDVRLLDFGNWKSSNYAGTQIPSLDDFLRLCKEVGIIPYLELKAGTRQQIESIVSLVKGYGLSESAVYISFSQSLLKYVSGVDKSATLGYLTGTPLTREAINVAKALDNESNEVFINSSDYSDTAVSLCREASIPLEVWTINSESTILSLSPYISGVTSDCLHAGRLLK